MWSLLSGVSPRSALARASATENQEWGNTEELLAAAVEQLDEVNRYLHKGLRFKGSPGKPMRVPRPYKPPKPPQMSKQELADAMKRLQATIEKQSAAPGLADFIAYTPGGGETN